MIGYTLIHSGSIRFTNDLNIGLYIYRNNEDADDLVLVVKDEISGTIIFSTAD